MSQANRVMRQVRRQQELVRRRYEEQLARGEISQAMFNALTGSGSTEALTPAERAELNRITIETTFGGGLDLGSLGATGFESSPIGYLGGSWSGPAAGNWSLNLPVGTFNDFGSWIPANYLSDTVHQDFFGNNQYQEFMRGGANTGGMTSLDSLFGGGQYLPTTTASQDIARQLSLLGQGLYDLFGNNGGWTSPGSANGGSAAAGNAIQQIINAIGGGGGGGGSGGGGGGLGDIIFNGGWGGGGSGGGGGGGAGSGGGGGSSGGFDLGDILGAVGAIGGLFGGGGTTDLQPMFRGQRAAGRVINSTFKGPQRRMIRDYLSNPIPVTPGEFQEAAFFGTVPGTPYGSAAGSQFQQLLDSAVGRVESNILPNVDELLATGFRTDIDPLIAEEMRRLREETAPALGARYRTALRSSGFDNATAQALEDLGIRLGTLNFNASEAAAGRRSNAITSGAAASAYQLPLNLRLGGALVTGSAGERARGRFESTRPGARLLSGLQGLSGIEQGGGFIQRGTDPSGSGATDLGAIISMLSNIGNSSPVINNNTGGGSSGGFDIGNIYLGSGLGGTDYNLPAVGGPRDPFAYEGIV